METVLSTLYFVLTFISPAFAADVAIVNKSGVFTCVFIGICALIIVSQLVPALVMFLGFIKSLVESVRLKMVASNLTPWMSEVHQGVGGIGDEEHKEKDPVAPPPPHKINKKKSFIS